MDSLETKVRQTVLFGHLYDGMFFAHYTFYLKGQFVKKVKNIFFNEQ